MSSDFNEWRHDNNLLTALSKYKMRHSRSFVDMLTSSFWILCIVMFIGQTFSSIKILAKSYKNQGTLEAWNCQSNKVELDVAAMTPVDK